MAIDEVYSVYGVVKYIHRIVSRQKYFLELKYIELDRKSRPEEDKFNGVCFISFSHVI